MRSLLVLSLCASIACGNSNRENKPATVGTAPDPAAPSADNPGADPSPGAASSAAPKLPVHRDLVTEAGRAELRAGGLWIDAGSLDLHKYTRGGWSSGWSRNARDDDGTSYAAIDGRSAWLDVVTLEPVAEIALRARANKSGARVDVEVDGKRRGRVDVDEGWGVHRVALDPPLPAGRHRVELGSRPDTRVDWVWLAAAAGAEPAASLDRVSAAQGADPAALVAPTPRTYSFYMDVPAGAVLELATGPTAGAAFAVRADAGDGAVDLARFEQEADGWRARSVGLDAVAGKTVRLDLVADTAGTAWRAPVIRAPAPKVAAVDGDTDRPKNLILLLIDTARADAFAPFSRDGKGVGAKAYDGLAERSTVFRNAYNNEQWTKPSTATTKTGVYPGSHGARWRVDKVSEEMVFISEKLKKAGFATASLVSNRSAGPKFGFDQGWDLFEKTGDAKQTFARGLKWIDEHRDGPFYLFFQTIDPHVPYVVPEKYRRPFYKGSYKGRIGDGFSQDEEDAINKGKLRMRDDDVAWVRALYNGEILYHDEYFGTFLAALEERGLMKDTLLVVLNDHGEDLGEHERFGHGWTMWEPQYRSPLLFHYPGEFPSGQVFEEIVEHVDVAPTILEVMGIDPMDRAEGRSLMPLVRGEPDWPRPYYALLFAKPDRRGVRVGRWKLVIIRDRHALYDLQADPDEMTDVWSDRPIAVRMCEVHLGEALANPDKAHRLDDVYDYQPYTPGRIKE